MPTTITRSIGATGRDHATVKSWLDWCASNYASGLVAADVILKGELYNDSEFSSEDYGGNSTCIKFPSLTTDSTRYFWLRPASGQSYAEASGSSTAPLRYDQSKGVGFRVTGNYNAMIHGVNFGAYTSRFLLEDCQFYYDSGYSSGYSQFGSTRDTSGDARLIMNRCLLETRGQGSHVSLFQGSNDIWTNCVIVQRSSTHGAAFIAGAGQLRNCTIVRPSDLTASTANGIESYGSYPLVKNCAVFGFGTQFGGTIASYQAGSEYNASSATGANIPGSNNQGSLTYADQFEVATDATRDWRPKAGGSLNTNGTRDNTYTSDLDVIGAARSLSAPSIGGREYAVAAGPSFSVFYRPPNPLLRY